MRMKNIMDILGLSECTIRYYEKKGIINVSRNKNNYWDFDMLSLFYLILYRQYSQLGISVEKTSAFMKDNDYKQLQNAIENRIKNLDQEIKLLEDRKTFLECKVNDLFWFQQDTNQIHHETVFKLYCEVE